MTHHKKPDLMTILPKDCAKGLLNDMGYERETNGHWSHSLQSSSLQHDETGARWEGKYQVKN